MENVIDEVIIEVAPSKVWGILYNSEGVIVQRILADSVSGIEGYQDTNYKSMLVGENVDISTASVANGKLVYPTVEQVLTPE